MDDLRLLQRPPAEDDATTKTLTLLNDRFPNWSALMASDTFDSWVSKSEQQATDLKSKVRLHLSINIFFNKLCH